MKPWPLRLSSGPGFHKPIARARREPSPARASSPRDEQGGMADLLIEGICHAGREGRREAFTPESSASVVGLSAWASDPTTPASAANAVPLAIASADAGPSLAHTAPARVPARRWWSAHADDGGRSAFPLDLLPSRPEESLARHFFSSGRPPGPVRGEKRRLKAYSASRSAKR
jgi:hypothetical protein